MSFIDLELEHTPLETAFLKGEVLGRKMIASHIGKLDKSWDILYRTTMSVFCVLAVGSDLVLVRNLVEKLLDFLRLMSNSYCSAMGLLNGEFSDLHEMHLLIDEVDQLANKLRDKMDSLGNTVLDQVAVDFAVMWSKHFHLFSEAGLDFGQELEHEEALLVKRVFLTSRTN